MGDLMPLLYQKLCIAIKWVLPHLESEAGIQGQMLQQAPQHQEE